MEKSTSQLPRPSLGHNTQTQVSFMPQRAAVSNVPLIDNRPTLIPDSPVRLRNIVPRIVSNDADLATNHPEKFARLVCAKLQRLIEAREDDSILSEHLERVMKTPKSNKNILRRRRSSLRQRIAHAQPSALDTKVGNWLATSCASTADDPGSDTSAHERGFTPGKSSTVKAVVDESCVNSTIIAGAVGYANLAYNDFNACESTRRYSDAYPENYAATTTKIPVYAFGSGGVSETNSVYEFTQFRDEGAKQATRQDNNGAPLSSDSGLSSIRVDGAESDVAESELVELNGLKQRLIEETEGPVSTKLLYHFNGEKFIVRVPGRPPTLAAMRNKMHCRGDYRFFVRAADAAWVEVTDASEPIYVSSNNSAEAKVIERY